MAGEGIGGIVAGLKVVFGVVAFPGTMRMVAVGMASKHETVAEGRTLSGTETVKTGLG